VATRNWVEGGTLTLAHIVYYAGRRRVHPFNLSSQITLNLAPITLNLADAVTVWYPSISVTVTNVKGPEAGFHHAATEATRI
jgi:hypothetical protein